MYLQGSNVIVLIGLICSVSGQFLRRQNRFNGPVNPSSVINNRFSNRLQSNRIHVNGGRQSNLMNRGQGIYQNPNTRQFNQNSGSGIYQNPQQSFGRTSMGSRGPPPNYLTAASMQKLLEYVNKHRSQVDAQNMLVMKWSNVLANKAAKRSQTCQFQFQSNTRGENMVMIPADRRNFDLVNYVIKRWYDEKNEFRLGIDCRATRPTSCNYSQMIWATSYSMGCASHWCAGQQFFVCLFEEMGNAPGSLPYIKGNHCERCPHSCRDQLCDWRK